MCHIFFLYSSSGGHVGCSHVLASVNDAASLSILNSDHYHQKDCNCESSGVERHVRGHDRAGTQHISGPLPAWGSIWFCSPRSYRWGNRALTMLDICPGSQNKFLTRLSILSPLSSHLILTKPNCNLTGSEVCTTYGPKTLLEKEERI